MSADSIDLFPHAKIWIQKEECGLYVGPNSKVPASRSRRRRGREDAGRARSTRARHVALVDGDDREILLSGIRVGTGEQAQRLTTCSFADVATRRPARFCSPFGQRVSLSRISNSTLAIAQTLDAASTFAAQARMLTLGHGTHLVIPRHDQTVFERSPTSISGVRPHRLARLVRDYIVLILS